ncbi:uncharacterized protein BDR25DRAFT_361377 [Lindgomyces ingoldianus]|uniref:Uncharacterized protein n=1 Tax=Lindgomyces ingoldianus TaxID=673940 RepID=A0ACB6QC74_9PLEO|nr:uncharacterized protein BDR25DRAFT_361377 [Lindgomyces ingoldianus]KAF2464538.1 hypothetical protein BDR25DRAFT_361377 [Lindgomyces ingoldianus]
MPLQAFQSLSLLNDQEICFWSQSRATRQRSSHCCKSLGPPSVFPTSRKKSRLHVTNEQVSPNQSHLKTLSTTQYVLGITSQEQACSLEANPQQKGLAVRISASIGYTKNDTSCAINEQVCAMSIGISLAVSKGKRKIELHVITMQCDIRCRLQIPRPGNLSEALETCDGLQEQTCMRGKCKFIMGFLNLQGNAKGYPSTNIEVNRLRL